MALEGRHIFEKFGRFPGATQFSEEKKQSGGNSGSLILYTNHKSFHCRLSFSDISTRYPKLNCYDFLIYILGYFLFHFTFRLYLFSNIFILDFFSFGGPLANNPQHTPQFLTIPFFEGFFNLIIHEKIFYSMGSMDY